MSPIVSPWWFYLFNLVENLRDGALAVLIFGGAGIIVIYIAGFMDDTTYKIPKWTTILLILSAVLILFTPSKETCYQMAAATLVTPDNISAVGETTKNAIDYIVESVDKVLDKENK
jgi:predicted MFS family arabinose efflux permease